MKDTLHAGVDGPVVGVEGCWSLWTVGRMKLLSHGQEGLDGFVAEKQEGRHSSQTSGNRLVFCGFAHPTHELFTPELFEIVGGPTRAVIRFALPTQRSHLLGQLRGRETAGSRGERHHGLGDPAHSWFVEVDATRLGLAELHGSGELLESFICDETLIDAGEALIKRCSMLFNAETISGNFSKERPQRSSAALWAMASMRSTRSPLV